MLKADDLVRLFEPCSFRRGSGLTTIRVPGRMKGRDYAAKQRVAAKRAEPVCRYRHKPMNGSRFFPRPPPARRRCAAAHPLAPTVATIDRFLAHCHRRGYPARTSVFMPATPAGTLYYVVRGSVSILTGGGGRARAGPGLPRRRPVRRRICSSKPTGARSQLRTRTQCESGEIGYERLYQLLKARSLAMPPAWSTPSARSCAACSTPAAPAACAFLDVTGSHHPRTLHDLAGEPGAMSHPQGTQLRSRARSWPGWSAARARWPARVLKKPRPTASCTPAARPWCCSALTRDGRNAMPAVERARPAQPRPRMPTTSRRCSARPTPATPSTPLSCERCCWPTTALACDLRWTSCDLPLIGSRWWSRRAEPGIGRQLLPRRPSAAARTGGAARLEITSGSQPHAFYRGRR